MHHIVHRMPQILFLPIQIRLFLEEEMQVVLLGPLVEVPSGLSVGVRSGTSSNQGGADAPKHPFQLFGGPLSPLSLILGSRQMYQSLFGLSREDRDSLNHAC